VELKMSKITYTSLLNAAIDLYMEEKYIEAYNFITENEANAEGNTAQIYNFRYCFACKAGLTELAMDIMKEAIVEKGYWYSYSYLIEDDDLKALREYSEFDELANICKNRELKAKENLKSDIKVIKPNNLVENKKYPLIIALHGNEENISIANNYWSSYQKDNYILALPQSSQIGFSDAYFWDDFQKGSKEVKEHYEKLLEDNNIDSNNIIIGGFSAGARTALYSILNNSVNVKGFIFTGPWLPEIDEWEHLLDNLESKGIKGYIICGDKDDDCFECTRKFVDMLNKRNISNTFKVIKDLKHDYPDNFDVYLKDAIEFIEG
jgi:predicted esterase